MLSKKEVTKLQNILENLNKKQSERIADYHTWFRVHGCPSPKLNPKMQSEVDFCSNTKKLMQDINENYDSIRKTLTPDDCEKLKKIEDMVKVANIAQSSFPGSLMLLMGNILSVGVGLGCILGGFLGMGFGTEVLIVPGFVLLSAWATVHLCAWGGAWLEYRNEPALMQIFFSGEFDEANKAVGEMQSVVNVATNQTQNPDLPQTGDEVLKLNLEPEVLVPVYTRVLATDPINTLTPVYTPTQVEPKR